MTFKSQERKDNFKDSFSEYIVSTYSSTDKKKKKGYCLIPISAQKTDFIPSTMESWWFE